MKIYTLLLVCTAVVTNLHAQLIEIDVTKSPVSVFIKDSTFSFEKDIQFLLAKPLPKGVTMFFEFMDSSQAPISTWSIQYLNGWKLIDNLSKNIPSIATPVEGEKPIFIVNVKPETRIKNFQYSLLDSTATAMKLNINEKTTTVRNMISFISIETQITNPTRRYNCIITNTERNYFTPEHSLLSGYKGSECQSCLNTYKVVYDLSSSEPKICYFKREKTISRERHKTQGLNECQCPAGDQYCYVSKRKINPRVGATVGFHIFGYYPSYDSIGTAFSFESRNLELKDSFAAIINPGSKTSVDQEPTDSPQDKKDETAQATSGNNLKDSELFFKKMRDEFFGYFQYLLKYSPDIALVNSDVAYINYQLNQYCLNMEEFSPKGLIIAVEKMLLNEAGTQEIKKNILMTTHQAAWYYGFILNYHAIKIPAVQIKNEDQFQWTVNFYKKNQKIDSRLYTMMVSGGWKIDFSSGFVFNTLKDKTYNIQYADFDITPDDNVDNPVEAGKIIQQDDGQHTVDIGLMVHVYPRTGTRVNLGANTGVVLRNGTSIKYILGLSVMLGYEQRFILSAGKVGGTINVLDKTYSDAFEQYVAKDRLTTISSNVPTVDFWDWGTYISITYNLGGVSLFSNVK